MMGRLFNFFCSNSNNEHGLYDFEKKLYTVQAVESLDWDLEICYRNKP